MDSEDTFLQKIAVFFLMLILLGVTGFIAYSLDWKNDRVEAPSQLVTINKNFHNSEHNISSYDAAVEYKIISDKALKNSFIKSHVQFEFSKDAMTMLVEEDNSRICQKTITELGKLSQAGELMIMVNGKPIKNVFNAESNIDYACAQSGAAVIKNMLR
jgi:hypothetical protein